MKSVKNLILIALSVGMISMHANDEITSTAHAARSVTKVINYLQNLKTCAELNNFLTHINTVIARGKDKEVPGAHWLRSGVLAVHEHYNCSTTAEQKAVLNKEAEESIQYLKEINIAQKLPK